jgi:hypothetical protein
MWKIMSVFCYSYIHAVCIKTLYQNTFLIINNEIYRNKRIRNESINNNNNKTMQTNIKTSDNEMKKRGIGEAQRKTN